jgi:hypothetical protein
MSEKTVRVTVCPWESKASVTLALIKVNHLGGGGGRAGKACSSVRSVVQKKIRLGRSQR